MKKILVPTDFSVNSKSGVKFAIHWAAQQKIELVFIHVLHNLRPIQWTDAEYAKYMKQEKAVAQAKIEKFIAAIYNSMKLKPGPHSFVIVPGNNADISLLDYSRKNKDIAYICISTHGAGTVERLLGTNTGNLITKSSVPVMAVPKNNKITVVKKVLYATDLRNYPEELKKVFEFAVPAKATVDVLHFTWPDETDLDEKSIEADLKKQYKYELNLHFEKNDAVHTLIEHIQHNVKLKKPSVVVMFTNQERTLFQRLFLSSKAEQLSFQLKVPLLVFNKNNKKR